MSQLEIRTSIGSVTEVNGKWNITFDTFIGRPDQFTNPSSKITTPTKFETEDEAYAAGNRALDILGAFPNFSEPF